MKRKYKIIISAIVVVAFIATIFLVYGINKKAKEVSNKTNNIINNITNETNTIDENVLNEIGYNEIDNTNTNVTSEDQNTNTNINKPEETNSEETNITNPEEKAIQLVKKDWGEDNKVMVTFEGIDNDGKYIIGIRDKETTYIKYWYHVDIKNETFTIKAN